jgi:hypothetical protein
MKCILNRPLERTPLRYPRPLKPSRRRTDRLSLLRLTLIPSRIFIFKAFSLERILVLFKLLHIYLSLI